MLHVFNYLNVTCDDTKVESLGCRRNLEDKKRERREERKALGKEVFSGHY